MKAWRFAVVAWLPLLVPVGAQADALIARIKDADVAAGAKLFKNSCNVCHRAEKGGKNKVGPNLWDIVGQGVAQKRFAYSPALKRLGGRWTYARLDAYLTAPMKFARGTRMAFPGLRNAGRRAAVIAFLRSRADRPVPLVVGAPTTAKPSEAKPTRRQPPPGPSVPMPEDAGREQVQTYCATCHSLKLVVQQHLSRRRWDEILDWMVEEQEMAAMPAKDRKLVLDYLVKHFGNRQP